mmetsp:Transcript_30380/g.70987  ORF Transcript_30380/g.70987 Transcript_30380/m.70987 type:complete len:86 (-) Transcript_30380:2040-2297(-)
MLLYKLDYSVGILRSNVSMLVADPLVLNSDRECANILHMGEFGPSYPRISSKHSLQLLVRILSDFIAWCVACVDQQHTQTRVTIP